ncbi:MAG: cytochrome c [Desulfuromonadia bacterium]
MGSHVFRPLFLVVGVVAAILLLRTVLVPADFGVHEQGYMYGWHRKGNEAEWKKVTVKYRGAEYCRQCHADKYDDIKGSPHAGINCENCHGPGMNHPDDPKTMTIDRRRELCVRCHFRLPYGNEGRGAIKGIDHRTHNPEEECTLCHYPHNPKKGVSK